MEWISDLEDKEMESKLSKREKKRIMQNKNRCRKLSDSIKHNIHIIGILEGEKREGGGAENICEK